MDYKYTFTVFTCTFNRRDLLHRVYDSLVKQTCTDFEWLLFDNGSTDDTASLVEEWKKEAPFDIKYLGWKDNTGYQNTFNESIANTEGRFWTSLDSDDACVPEALESLLAHWNNIPEEEREQFVGVVGNCNDQHGNFVGTPYPSSPIDSNTLEIRYRYNVKGEKWGFLRTDVLKQFPFPKHDTHIMPGLVWNRISRKYKTRFINESLRVYYINEVSRIDQVTHGFSTSADNAYGRRLNSLEILNHDIGWFKFAPLQFLKEGIVYSCFCSHMAIPAKQQFKDLSNAGSKLLFAVTYPAGLMAYWVSKFRS